MRPSCTATTGAFRALVRSTSRGARASVAAAAAAAGVATGALDGAGKALLVGAPHTTRVPPTRRRPSIRPVSVAITGWGKVEISLARRSTELTYSSEWL